MEIKEIDNSIMEIIARQFDDGFSGDDAKILEEWIAASESNRKAYMQMVNIWDASLSQPELCDIDDKAALRQALNQINGKPIAKILWEKWQKVAAVILLPLLVCGYLLFGGGDKPGIIGNEPIYAEMSVPYGTRAKIVLPDSSFVWLNSGSTLKYPTEFIGDRREVSLVGEGLFEVHSDASRPFIVTTDNLSVKATGTVFNVFDYETTEAAAVTLVNGKVSVNSFDKSGKRRLFSDMEPNRHLVINKATFEMSLDSVDTYRYTAWKDGMLVFRNDPFPVVVERLGQIFDVDIILQGQALTTYEYRASFHGESLTEIMKLLKLSSPIDYVDVDRSILDDGSFTRRTIIIFPIGSKPIMPPEKLQQ